MATSGRDSDSPNLSSYSDALDGGVATQASARGGAFLPSPTTSHLLASTSGDDAMDITGNAASSNTAVPNASLPTFSSVAASKVSRPATKNNYSGAESLKSYISQAGSNIVLDIPASSPAGTAFTENLAKGVHFEALPDTPLRVYADAIAQRFPSQPISHMYRRGRLVVVYLATAEIAKSLLTSGLTIGDRHLSAEPVAQRPVNVSFYPVPLEVTDLMLYAVLSSVGRVVGGIQTHLAARSDPLRDPRHASIHGARRVARVIFPSQEAIERLPTHFTVRCEDQVRRINFLTEFHCSQCHQVGHNYKQCPDAPPKSVSPILPMPSPQDLGSAPSPPMVPAAHLPKVTTSAPIVAPPPFSKEHYPALQSSTPFCVPADPEAVDESIANDQSDAETSTADDAAYQSISDHAMSDGTEGYLRTRQDKREAPKPSRGNSKRRRQSGQSTQPAGSTASSRTAKSSKPVIYLLPLEDFSARLHMNMFPDTPLPYDELHDFACAKTLLPNLPAYVNRFEGRYPAVANQLAQLLTLYNNIKSPSAEDAATNKCIQRRYTNFRSHLEKIATATIDLAHSL